MKKLIISLFLCVALLLGMVPFTAFAEESSYEFEYIKRDVSTGDGCVIVEYSGQRVELSGNTATTRIPKGADVTVTIKANKGSAITALAYDGGPMGFGDPALELNMTIDNYSGDHSLKITYMATSYNCSVSSTGRGSVSILAPATSGSSVSVPMGDTFGFFAQADDGYEILSIAVNGEYVDLTKYGQTDVIKITRFNMELPEICEDTQVVVTFSADAVEYVNLTLDWNEGGICNFGQKNVKVIKGNMFGIVIAPMEGYKVARITDGDKIVTNFSGITYYADNISSDRTVTIEFEKAEEIKMYGDVNNDGRVSVNDATLVQKSVAGIVNFNSDQNLYGDVDADGRISVKDATTIQKFVADIIQIFPAQI